MLPTVSFLGRPFRKKRIQDSAIKEMVFLDTVSIPEEKMIEKITLLSVAPVFAEAIERIYEDKPEPLRCLADKSLALHSTMRGGSQVFRPVFYLISLR